jgi:predicted nucleic-acid-binding Zn-ribbon protein
MNTEQTCQKNKSNNVKNKEQTLITQFFKPVIKEEKEYDYHNYCLECGGDMGDYPGQLCCKTYCGGIY